MKNNNFTKIALAILAISLCLGAIFAMSISANTTETKPEIISQNIEYSNEFKIMYAVDAETVAPGAVTLYLYNTEPVEGTTPYRTYTAESATPTEESGLDKAAYIFTTEGVSYLAMTTNFYVQAKDSADKFSEVKRYSVAEYLYERLASTDASEKQKKFYNSTIQFGSDAQDLLSPAGTKLVSEYRYVTVEGGKINGYAKGVYPIGTELTPVANTETTEKWAVTTINSEGKPTVTNGNTSYTVIDAVKAEITLGLKVVYRDDIETLEGYDPTETIPSPLNKTLQHVNASYETLKLVNVGGSHGMVAEYVTNNRAGGAKLNNVDKANYNDETDTALEFSFDMKVTTTLVDGKSSAYVQINARGTAASASSALFQANWYTYDGTTLATSLDLTNNKKVAETKNYAVDPQDWVHVRVVFYKDNTNMYIYINDGEAQEFVTQVTANNYTGDIASIAQLTVIGSDRNTNNTILIDNFFVGYITEAAPTTPAEQ